MIHFKLSVILMTIFQHYNFNNFNNFNNILTNRMTDTEFVKLRFLISS